MQVLPVRVVAPREPGQLGVVAERVVVAALGAAALVAGGQHRHAGREQQRAEQVRGLPPAQRRDGRVVGLALDAAVPGAVVVGCRRGCPRRWRGCACRCTTRGRASVKPSWAVTKLTDENGSRPSSA